MGSLDRGITRIRNGEVISTLFKGYDLIRRKLRDRIMHINLIDNYYYRQSIKELRDRQRQEAGLIGILTVAYGFQGKGLYRSIKPQQEGQELAIFAERVSEKDPETVVEIGTAEGGSLYTWCRYLDSAETIVSIDADPNFPKRTKFFREFNRDLDMVFLYGLSYEDETIDKVKQSINNGVDFLFIDGDHTYEGVKRDFQLYSPLVNEGGVIAFHDIVEVESEYMGVPQFWNEIKDNYESEEIIQPEDKTRGGVGLLYM